MGSLHDAVMEYVARETKKDPGVKNATPFAGAREIDGAIRELGGWTHASRCDARSAKSSAWSTTRRAPAVGARSRLRTS